MCTFLRKSLIILILYKRHIQKKSVLEVYFDVLELSKFQNWICGLLLQVCFCSSSPYAPPFFVTKTDCPSLAPLARFVGPCSFGPCSLAPTHIARWIWLRTDVIDQCSCCTSVHTQHCVTYRDLVAHAHRFRRLRSIAPRIVLLEPRTDAPPDPTAHQAYHPVLLCYWLPACYAAPSTLFHWLRRFTGSFHP